MCESLRLASSCDTDSWRAQWGGNSGIRDSMMRCSYRGIVDNNNLELHPYAGTHSLLWYEGRSFYHDFMVSSSS